MRRLPMDKTTTSEVGLLAWEMLTADCSPASTGGPGTVSVINGATCNTDDST